MKKNTPDILIIGPFPPPLHGASLITQRLSDHLEKKIITRVVSVSSRTLKRGLLYHYTRITRQGRALLNIFLLRNKTVNIYISLSGGKGQLYEIVLLFFARQFGYKIFLHHHSFAYLQEPLRLFTMLTRIAGTEAVHICLCRAMAEKLSALYPSASNTLVLSNISFVDLPARSPRRADEVLVLGHLSNLSLSKGLDLVIEVTRRAILSGTAVKLILAGPPVDITAQRLIGDAQNEFGATLDHRGPVYGEDKDAFFRDIDIFLFPSQYVNEAQPVVVLEALAAGIPVVAMDRGCICDDVGIGGLTAPDPEKFLQRAQELITHFSTSPRSREIASQKAVEQAKSLVDSSHTQLAGLVTHIKSNAAY